jgi:hypothetical protein
MSTTTASKIPTGPRFSNHWAAARVARRLVNRYTAPIAGRLVAAHLVKKQGSRHPEWAFRWVYWLTVLREVEKRCGYTFPVPESPIIVHARAVA